MSLMLQKHIYRKECSRDLFVKKKVSILYSIIWVPFSSKATSLLKYYKYIAYLKKNICMNMPCSCPLSFSLSHSLSLSPSLSPTSLFYFLFLYLAFSRSHWSTTLGLLFYIHTKEVDENTVAAVGAVVVNIDR